MKKTYLAAAALCVLAAVVRTIDGEMILADARGSVNDDRLLGFVHLTWYLVTVVFAFAALTLGWAARPSAAASSRALGLFFGVLFLSWSVAIAATGFAFVWHPGVVIPAIVTLLIGTLCLMGARRAKAPDESGTTS